MEAIEGLKVKIKNYKSFGEVGGGFEQLVPINIIIGRNNTGKSSLIELIEYLVNPHGFDSSLGHKGSNPEVVLTSLLTSLELKGVFPENRTGGGYRDESLGIWLTLG